MALFLEGCIAASLGNPSRRLCWALLFTFEEASDAAFRARATALAMSCLCKREQELSFRFLLCSRKLAIVRISAPAATFSRWIASTSSGASARARALQRGDRKSVA